MPLDSFVVGIIETAVNKLHTIDDSAISKRKQLNGAVIQVDIKEIKRSLYFIISNQQIDILTKYESEATCVIRLNMSALIELQDNSALTKLIKNGKLDIEGDVQIVQQFAQLLTEMKIDWEEQLSQKIGDVLAHKVCYVGKKAKKSIQKQYSQLERQAAEFITEELKLAPGGLEVAYFCDQVETLEMQLSELEKRINKMSSHD
jgi:ubiquinone biosynthesis protein UbiJ